jgi:hypothetical protein
MAWTERTSPTTTFTEQDPVDMTWDDMTMTWDEATLTWDEYGSTNWDENDDEDTDWDNSTGYLLQEAGDYILLEDGGRIKVVGEPSTAWTERTGETTNWTTS